MLAGRTGSPGTLAGFPQYTPLVPPPPGRPVPHAFECLQKLLLAVLSRPELEIAYKIAFGGIKSL